MREKSRANELSRRWDVAQMKCRALEMSRNRIVAQVGYRANDISPFTWGRMGHITVIRYFVLNFNAPLARSNEPLICFSL